MVRGRVPIGINEFNVPIMKHVQAKTEYEFMLKAAKMVLEYTVSKEKGSNQYYVCRVGKERIPLTPRFTTKKKALHKAAEMQGIAYELYMKIRRRDCVSE